MGRAIRRAHGAQVLGQSRRSCGGPISAAGRQRDCAALGAGDERRCPATQQGRAGSTDRNLVRRLRFVAAHRYSRARGAALGRTPALSLLFMPRGVSKVSDALANCAARGLDPGQDLRAPRGAELAKAEAPPGGDARTQIRETKHPAYATCEPLPLQSTTDAKLLVRPILLAWYTGMMGSFMSHSPPLASIAAEPVTFRPLASHWPRGRVAFPANVGGSVDW